MDRRLLEVVACPVCQGGLTFHGEGDGGRIDSGRLDCPICGLSFEVNDGVPVLVAPDTDLNGASWSWESAEEQLAEWIPMNFRGFLQAELRDYALEIVEAVRSADGPALDVASGPGGGYCVPVMRDGRTDRLLIMSDLGRPVIETWNRHLREMGWADRCSMAVCDARRLPFYSRSMALVTSIGGLSNVLNDGPAYAEVARVLRPGAKLYDYMMLFEEGGPTQRHMRDSGWATSTWAEYEALMDGLGLTIESCRTARIGRGKKHPGDGAPLSENETWEDRIVVSVRP